MYCHLKQPYKISLQNKKLILFLPNESDHNLGILPLLIVLVGKEYGMCSKGVEEVRDKKVNAKAFEICKTQFFRKVYTCTACSLTNTALKKYYRLKNFMLIKCHGINIQSI